MSADGDQLPQMGASQSVRACCRGPVWGLNRLPDDLGPGVGASLWVELLRDPLLHFPRMGAVPLWGTASTFRR